MKIWQSIIDRFKSPEQRLADAKRDFEKCMVESAEDHKTWELQRAEREAQKKREQDVREQEAEARRNEQEARLARRQQYEMEAASRPAMPPAPKPADMPADIRLFLLSLWILKQPQLRPIIEAGPPYPAKLAELMTDVEKDFESLIRANGFWSKHLTDDERYALMDQCGSLGDRRIWGWVRDLTPTKQQFLDEAKQGLLETVGKDVSIGDVINVLQSLKGIERRRNPARL